MSSRIADSLQRTRCGHASCRASRLVSVPPPLSAHRVAVDAPPGDVCCCGRVSLATGLRGPLASRKARGRTAACLSALSSLFQPLDRAAAVADRSVWTHASQPFQAGRGATMTITVPPSSEEENAPSLRADTPVLERAPDDEMASASSSDDDSGRPALSPAKPNNGAGAHRPRQVCCARSPRLLRLLPAQRLSQRRSDAGRCLRTRTRTQPPRTAPTSTRRRQSHPSRNALLALAASPQTPW